MPAEPSQSQAASKLTRKPTPKPTPRHFVKLLDGLDEAIWVLDNQQRVVWVNERTCQWLHRSAESLIGNPTRSSGNAAEVIDPLLASLAAPVGLAAAGLLCLTIDPPNLESRQARFLQLGSGDSALTIASTGDAITQASSMTAADLLKMHEQLQSWRKQDIQWGGIAASGSSVSAKRLRAQIQIAMTSAAHCTIVGPAGCGAQWIARSIHGRQQSLSTAPAYAQTFIPIDGSLMDAELLEAALSPARALVRSERTTTESKPIDAKLTLFLFNIEETPLEVQQQIEPFLASHSQQVRLIAWTHKSPADLQRDQKLLPALAYRIDPLCIELPGLAARSEDIPLMATALVDQRHLNLAGPAQRLGRDAMDRMMIYPWPGNFEELDAAIRHACARCDQVTIALEHLPLAIRSYEPSDPSVKSRRAVEVNLEQALRSYELQLIDRALHASGGNRSQAAKSLGISRATLLRRLEDSPHNSLPDEPDEPA